jgi:predicted N-acetyltransferase YhbS
MCIAGSLRMSPPRSGFRPASDARRPPAIATGGVLGLAAHMTPRRVTESDELPAVLALIRAAFAGMEGRVDPPSSMHRLTVASLAREAETGEVWVIRDGAATVACAILSPRPGQLYLGKLAVDARWRGRGLARRLVDVALRRAAALCLPQVVLQTRVELAENHAAFAALGFRVIGQTAHPGYLRPTSLTFARKVPPPDA